MVSYQERMRRLVEDTDHIFGRIFTLTIQSLIVISLITFSIGTLPDLSTKTKNILYAIEAITVFIFTIEYILRILITQNKLRYIFSFYGLIDLVAILPFYISSGVDLRSVRAFRLLRLIRIFKLLKYNQATKRFQRAISIVREELLIFSFVAAITLYLSSVGIYYFENEAQPEYFKSVFHCLWWALTTLTTVGYGDMYPITAGGKIFTFFVLILGLGIVAIPTGLVASALSKAREEEH